jgi:heme/copper-type cytochrome/quinol oxidase subunit 4
MEISKLIRMYCIYLITTAFAFGLALWSGITHETLEIQKIPDNIFIKIYNIDTFIYIIISLNLVYFYHLLKNKNYLYILHLLISIFLIGILVIGYIKRLFNV